MSFFFFIKARTQTLHQQSSSSRVYLSRTHYTHTMAMKRFLLWRTLMKNTDKILNDKVTMQNNVETEQPIVLSWGKHSNGRKK